MNKLLINKEIRAHIYTILTLLGIGLIIVIAFMFPIIVFSIVMLIFGIGSLIYLYTLIYEGYK